MKRELTLDEIHEELLCQLRDIKAICDRHGIEYNLMCGTLLGAVRHKGFIPWDDDVDLLMTREEFTKFRQIYPKECDSRFELTYLDTWTPRAGLYFESTGLILMTVFEGLMEILSPRPRNVTNSQILSQCSFGIIDSFRVSKAFPPLNLVLNASAQMVVFLRL